MASLSGKNGGKQHARQNDNLSEDEECTGDLREEEGDGQENKSENGDSRLEFPRTQWHCPPKNIWKPSVEAMQEFDMIRDNDRVLVCLSANGKDSLSLLHTLHQYRFYARSKGIDFEIGAVTVDAGGADPLELMSYLKTLDVPYLYEEQVTDSSSANVDNNQLDASGACSFCDRSVRMQLYSLAKRNGYNVLALGQHLDDLTESFLISVFHGGMLKTMKAHYYIRREDLRVIRPFIYVREKALKQFAESKKLRISQESRSPYLSEKQSRRKELMLQQERTYPRLHWSVRTALRPLITAHGQITAFDFGNGNNLATSPSSTSSSISSSCSSSTSGSSSVGGSGNGSGGSTASSNQQKRHRRTKTNLLATTSSSQPTDENDETDEEPVL